MSVTQDWYIDLTCTLTSPIDPDTALTTTEQLADAYAVYLKTHGYHWNVRGPEFFTYHNLLEQQYRDLYSAETARPAETGADPAGPSRYLRSKAAGEAVLSAVEQIPAGQVAMCRRRPVSGRTRSTKHR